MQNCPNKVFQRLISVGEWTNLEFQVNFILDALNPWFTVDSNYILATDLMAPEKLNIEMPVCMGVLGLVSNIEPVFRMAY